MAAFLDLEDMNQVYALAIDRLNGTAGELTLGNLDFIIISNIFYLGNSADVSPGLVVDNTISILTEQGYDLTKPNLSQPMSRQQELDIVAMVTQRTVCVLNGVSTCDSYFDRYIEGATVFSGTTYDFRRGRVLRHDFSIRTQTQRSLDGTLTGTVLPNIFTADNIPLPLIPGMLLLWKLMK